MMDVIVERPEGLYCPPGDFYIDPWRPVDRAVIRPSACRIYRWRPQREIFAGIDAWWTANAARH